MPLLYKYTISQIMKVMCSSNQFWHSDQSLEDPGPDP